MKIEEEMLSESLICVDPEVGEHYFEDYFDDKLTPEQSQAFEDHLEVCLKCQEDQKDLDRTPYTKRIEKELRDTSPEVWILQPTSIMTGDNVELIDWYYHRQTRSRLAAAGKKKTKSPSLIVTYDNGQAKGEFFREGTQLFFKLQLPQETSSLYYGVLSYSSPLKTGEHDTFEIQHGEQKRLGSIVDLCPEFSIDGLLETIRNFKFALVKPHSA